MAVYFVYRSGYLPPRCLYQRRFDDATVLDWFRREWVGVEDEDEAIARAERVLGTEVAYFPALFLTIARDSVPPPQTMAEVADGVAGGYPLAICHEEHCLQVLTDDDEIQLAYYFFDDAFLAAHGGLASFVLLDDWRLPDGEGAGGWAASVDALLPLGGDGPGWLYVADLELVCEYLDDLSPVWQIKGVRVPGLCRWLMGLDDAKEEDFGWSLVRLRETLLSGDLAEGAEELAFLLALRENPQDDLTWNAYSDWLLERGGRPAGLHLLERALPRLQETRSKGLDQVGDHVVQTFQAYGNDDRCDHWFFFDDLWGSAHPDLADALLRFATRWDVLSTGDEQRYD